MKLPCSHIFQLLPLFLFLHSIRLEFVFLCPSTYSPGIRMLPLSNTAFLQMPTPVSELSIVSHCSAAQCLRKYHYFNYSGFVKWLNV